MAILHPPNTNANPVRVLLYLSVIMVPLLMDVRLSFVTSTTSFSGSTSNNSGDTNTSANTNNNVSYVLAKVRVKEYATNHDDMVMKRYHDPYAGLVVVVIESDDDDDDDSDCGRGLVVFSILFGYSIVTK